MGAEPERVSAYLSDSSCRPFKTKKGKKRQKNNTEVCMGWDTVFITAVCTTKGEISFETHPVVRSHKRISRKQKPVHVSLISERVLDVELSAQAYFMRFDSYALPNVTR